MQSTLHISRYLQVLSDRTSNSFGCKCSRQGYGEPHIPSGRAAAQNGDIRGLVRIKLRHFDMQVMARPLHTPIMPEVIQAVVLGSFIVVHARSLSCSCLVLSQDSGVYQATAPSCYCIISNWDHPGIHCNDFVQPPCCVMLFARSCHEQVAGRLDWLACCNSTVLLHASGQDSHCYWCQFRHWSGDDKGPAAGMLPAVLPAGFRRIGTRACFGTKTYFSTSKLPCAHK